MVYLFAFAYEFVSFLYTQAYQEAASVIRVYSLAVFFMSVEISSILIVLQQGKFVMRSSALMILITIVVSYAGSKIWGLPGGALGTVMSVVLVTVLYYRRIMMITGVPFKSIQRWDVLGKMLVSAFIAAVSTYLGVINMAGLKNEFSVLMVAGVLELLLYFLLLQQLGVGWLLQACIGRQRWRKHSF